MKRSTAAGTGVMNATGTHVLRLLLVYLRPHWLTLLGGFVAARLLVRQPLRRRHRPQPARRSHHHRPAFDRRAVVRPDGADRLWGDVLLRRRSILPRLSDAQGGGSAFRCTSGATCIATCSNSIPTFYDINSHSEVQTRLVADTQEMERLIGQFVPNIVHAILLLVAAGGYAIYLNPSLSLIIAGCIPLILLPGGFLSGPMAKLADRRQGALAQAGSYAAEILRNLKLMQAFGQQRRSADRYDALLGQGYALALRSRLEIALTATTSFFAYAVLALIIWYAGRDVLAGKSPAGDLVGYIFYANLATTAVASIITQWASMRGASGAASRLLELRGERSRLVRSDGAAPSGAPLADRSARCRAGVSRRGFQLPRASPTGRWSRASTFM